MSDIRNMVGAVLVAWATVGIPAMCQGRLLVHECMDAPRHGTVHEEGACGQEHESDSTSRCHHEDGCAQDPCGEAFAKRDDNPKSVELAARSAALVPHGMFIAAPESAGRAASLASWPERLVLPFPPSAQPLRI